MAAILNISAFLWGWPWWTLRFCGTSVSVVIFAVQGGGGGLILVLVLSTQNAVVTSGYQLYQL